MPVINGVYLKDFTALPSSVTDANIIPIAITGNQIAYRTTVGGIVTDARVTGKLLTGLSVTGGAIAATDTILAAFGKVQNQINSKVSSVGLTMPSAFNVANSPITSSGTLAVTAAGAASQYIRGDGALADFPTSGGGGSSVSYYLNGSVNQGTFVGNVYKEMNKTPVIGAGTDFTINANGYIAQFITDANDPASLLIPAGNWNVEMYFSASSHGGTPSFYVEVYKYNGTTFTLLGTSSASPEGITNGTAIDIYYTSVGIPETVLTITDRLAIRVYVTHSGKTITLHTEDNHLSEIVTTFSNGLTALNGLTKQAQYFAVGSTGTDFNIASSVDTHTFNIPSASATNRGLITTGAQTIAGAKTLTGALVGTTANFTGQLTLGSTITNGTYTYTLPSATGTLALTSALSGYVPYTGATTDLVLGANNFSSKRVSILKSSDGFGGFVSNYLFLQTGTSSGVVGTDGVSLNSKPNTRGLVINYDIATVNYSVELNASLLTNSRTLNFPDASGTLALVGGAGVGTVTSVAALTLGTSGTDLSSTVANGTTTPVITLNVPTASATNRGALSSADWTTFNSKQGTITLTTTGTSGAATFVANTLNIPNYADGGVLSLSAIGATPNANAATITGTVLNLQPASASFGGVITTGTQTFAGAKTFSSDLTVNTLTVGQGGGAIFSNTAFGINALFSNTTGQLNTAIGYNSGYLTNAGAANQTSQTSVYIGADTRASASGNTNQIVIGCNGRGLGSNTTVLGNPLTVFGRFWGNLLVGDSSNSGEALQITGTSKFTGALSGTSATFSLDSTVNGVTVGRGAGNISSNTALGLEAFFSGNTTGTNNTAVGVGALRINTASNSTAVGTNALTVSTTAGSNTGIGSYALQNITTGGNNTAIGVESGKGITTGTGNTILGITSVSLAAGLTNNIILSNGTGAIKAQHDGTNWTFTGGTTLTGALSGTSASFSGDGSFGSGASDVTITIPTNNSGSGYAGRILGKNSTGQLIIQHRDNSATFVNAITISSGGGTPVITFGGRLSGTSATFSGDVTNGGYFITPASATSGGISGFVNQYNSGNASSRSWKITNDILAYGDFAIQQSTTQTGSTYASQLYFSSTGAATFSSSVTAAGATFSGTTAVASAAGTSQMRIDRSGTVARIQNYDTGQAANISLAHDGGNVGIGLTNPDAKLFVKGSGGSQLLIDYQGTPTNYYDADTHIFRSYFSNTYPERMRITSGGELYWNVIGTSGANLNGGGVLFRNNSGKYIQLSTGLTTDASLMLFYKSDGAGSVTNTGSIATSGNSTLYNTTSDYRLKEDLQDFNAIEKISSIKIYDFAWKSDKTRSFGVLAHELAKVLPYSVFGEKDAIQEDEEIQLQQVDYSKIVPILVKAMQEQQAQIEELKALIKPIEPIAPEVTPEPESETDNNLE